MLLSSRISATANRKMKRPNPFAFLISGDDEPLTVVMSGLNATLLK